MIKRFARLDIATADLADAAATYQRNFGFALRRGDSGEATIALGDAEIRLRSGPAAAGILSATGEGLAAIWLEADDVDQVAEVLKKAGIACSLSRIEDRRRVLTVDPASTNRVPLFIFDQR